MDEETKQYIDEQLAKFSLKGAAVKAVGDWELDVTAIPFNSRDSDKQWFDDNTDIMHEAFSTPLVVYQHGIKQGGQVLDDRPLVIGKTVPGSLVKKFDGWHLRVILNQAIKQAKDIMDAAHRGFVAVSSGSIAHLARLDIGGKLQQYEKNKPGRIAVWALGEISLWERGNGNVNPANQFAVALPVMKAMYREAGLPFPEIDTHGEAEAETVKHRTAVKLQAERIIKQIEKMENK